MFCARVCAGEGGGGKDTADIEAASCVFFCLQGGGQRGELRSGDAILARRSKVSLVPDMAREQAQGGESDCLELYKCLLALLCTDGVTPALSRRAAQNYASSWITPRL